MSISQLCVVFFVGSSLSSGAAISLGGSTQFWSAVNYANPSQADPSDDLQTGGIEGDIVGNAAHAVLYTAFDDGGTPANLLDGNLGLRLRLGGDANPAGLKTVVWFGLDANLDGRVDLFIGTIEDTKVGVCPAGDGLNTSPSTTSIKSSNPYFETPVSTLNFNFTPVSAATDPAATSYNLDGKSGGGANHTDHFVSISVPFSQLATAVSGLNLPGLGTFTQQSPVNFIAATSNQANSLNMDLNGIGKTYDATATWTSLGGFTQTYSITGAAVPEVSTAGLMMLAGLSLIRGRRR